MLKKFDFKKTGTKVVGLAAGSIAAKAATKMVPFLSPMVKAGALIVIGALLPAFMPKNEIVTSVGDGMIASAASDLASQTIPALAGIGEVGETAYIEEDYANVNGQDDYNAKIYGSEESDNVSSMTV